MLYNLFFAKQKNSLEKGVKIHKTLELLFTSKKPDDILTSYIFSCLEDNSKKVIINFIQSNLYKSIINSDKVFTEIPIHVGNDFNKKYNVYDNKDNLEKDTKFIRIDLLTIKKNQINIIDYKTDNKPESDIKNLAPSYQMQLKKYTKAVSLLWKDHIINSYIIWLKNCSYLKVT